MGMGWCCGGDSHAEKVKQLKYASCWGDSCAKSQAVKDVCLIVVGVIVVVVEVTAMQKNQARSCHWKMCRVAILLKWNISGSESRFNDSIKDSHISYPPKN